LLDMAADDYQSPRTREEARRLMRVLIAERLGGQVLHTRAVLSELQDL
jgi:DNA repair protein RecO (recombination protein O)